jgi:competence ComEA-like helix-hairpin-helix protein
MSPYTRPQLWMLVALTALGGLGVAAGSWRRAHPDLTERFERFDAEYVAPPSTRRFPKASPKDETSLNPPGDVSAAATDPTGAMASRSPGRQLSGTLTPPKTGSADSPLDLNRATTRDLERLPGIGPALAERIVASRERAGRFASIEDLQRVPGLGRTKLRRLHDLITITNREAVNQVVPAPAASPHVD